MFFTLWSPRQQSDRGGGLPAQSWFLKPDDLSTDTVNPAHTKRWTDALHAIRIEVEHRWSQLYKKNAPQYWKAGHSIGSINISSSDIIGARWENFR